MKHVENLSPQGRSLLNRRSFLGTAGLSAAGLGLASVLSHDGLLAEEKRTSVERRPFGPRSIPSSPTLTELPISSQRRSRFWSSTCLERSVTSIHSTTSLNYSNLTAKNRPGSPR